MDPTERSMQMRYASHVSWANTPDRKARVQPAIQGQLARFERLVDPEGVLPEAERKARAESARKAHMTQMALRSAQARRIKKQAADEAKRKKAARELAAYKASKNDSTAA